MEVQELKQKAEELHSEYAFSRVELAKIMVIVSATLIVVSIPAALSFQSAANQAKSVNSQLSQTAALVNSERVQTSLDVLRNTGGSSFDQIAAAINAVERTDKAVNSTQNLQNEMDRSKEMYQWLVLIGIIGEVAGIAIYFS